MVFSQHIIKVILNENSTLYLCLQPKVAFVLCTLYWFIVFFNIGPTYYLSINHFVFNIFCDTLTLKLCLSLLAEFQNVENNSSFTFWTTCSVPHKTSLAATLKPTKPQGNQSSIILFKNLYYNDVSLKYLKNK